MCRLDGSTGYSGSIPVLEASGEAFRQRIGEMYPTKYTKLPLFLKRTLFFFRDLVYLKLGHSVCNC
jgi:hypothetical protein